MLIVAGTFTLPPQMLPSALPAMARMMQASRAEDGCLEYVYAQDLQQPGTMHVKEVWRDRAALDAHFSSPHLKEWRASWTALGIGDRNLRLYEVGNAQSI